MEEEDVHSLENTMKVGRMKLLSSHRTVASPRAATKIRCTRAVLRRRACGLQNVHSRPCSAPCISPSPIPPVGGSTKPNPFLTPRQSRITRYGEHTCGAFILTNTRKPGGAMYLIPKVAWTHCQRHRIPWYSWFSHLGYWRCRI